MIGIKEENYRDVPVLVVADVDKQKVALPTMVFFHGFTSAREHSLPIAFLLAEKGFRVILPDSLHHGVRDEGLDVVSKQLAFWDIVSQNVEDLGLIKEELDKRNLIKNGNIGVAGTSMGGITTAAVLTQYPWIKAAVSLMGTPKMTEYASYLIDNVAKEGSINIPQEEIDAALGQISAYDLSKHVELLNNRPFLIWHGDNDKVVPYDFTKSFYDEYKGVYTNPEYIQMITEKNRGHKVSRKAILATVNWFVTFLG